MTAILVVTCLILGIVVMVIGLGGRTQSKPTGDTAKRFSAVQNLPGCSNCGNHARWYVDGPQDLTPRVTYDTVGEAMEVADNLNLVYAAGKKAGHNARQAEDFMDGYNKRKAEETA